MKSLKNARAFIGLLLLLSVIPGLAHAADGFILVSDVDDTVKVTDVAHLKHAIKAALKSRLGFAGMPELYQQLLGPGSPPERLTFVSGSSTLLDEKVDAMLRDARFPAYSLVLRRKRDSFENIFDFKLARLRALYGSSTAEFLFIGDDTEKDPEVYVAFSRSPRDRIYIHRVTGRSLPSRCVPFVTAYDIAVQEFQAGRMTEAQAAAVGIAVLTANDRSLFPTFQNCPGRFERVTGLPDSLVRLKEYIEGRITNLCAERSKP